MTKQERGDIILALRPRAQYTGCWYDDSVVWLDEEPMPTEEEIQAEWDKQQEAKRKLELIEQIYANFERDGNAPVECVVPEGTFVMDGGYDSAQRIKNAADLAVILGEAGVYLTDKNNIPHQMSVESAGKVAAQIGLKWRDAFFTKQMALIELNK